MSSSNSKMKRHACDEGISECHASKRARPFESDPKFHSTPSRSLPPPERPGSLQDRTDSLDGEDDVEEIARSDEAGYTYTRLRRREFRLLRLHPAEPGGALHCSLVTDSIDTPSSYEALSYCWGVSEPAQRILISDELDSGFTSPTHFQVGPNLYSALHAVRMPNRPRVVWVDALCINQVDREEKNNQVSMMHEIYSKACQVIIWLGSPDPSSEFLFANLHQVFRPGFFSDGGDNGNAVSDPGFVSRMKQALTDLFSRPYWERAWIAQEVILAAEATAVVGQRQVDLADLRVAQELFSTADGIHDGTRATAPDGVAALLNGRNELLRTSSTGDVIARTKSAVELLLQFRGSEATDPRDRIYSLLSLSNDGGTIPVDYNKSAMQVFADFVSTCIERQGLLDLVLIPWAPVKRFKRSRNRRSTAACEASTTPSWLAPLEDLPHGSPEGQDQPGRLWKSRLNGDGLVNMPAIYDASHGMKLEVSFGPMIRTRRRGGGLDIGEHSETKKGTLYNPVLHVGGIKLGTITDLSTRMADGLISRDALELAGIPFTKGCEALRSLPDAMVRRVWRTLVCDRDADGKPAPTRFGLAIKHLFKRMLESRGLDTLEILEDGNEVDPNTREFLKRVHDMTFNRRIFVSNINEFQENLLGQAPKEARIGDTIALFFGNSVPVILRPSCDGGGRYMEIVGAAYVDGKMQGEILHELGEDRIDEIAQTFEII
ncbi:hypothetical protein N8I77_012541 [Diaporthe amygdali]|uniref:Heterokaryon incompatibility domain-containing protein n=1 Tax=Phomopsis amygdali TaxID=1214568 RepID=A0AAD9VXC1_PHOAM|nr:hypothetical protein N8I77_012541 [Diaporthe amygdali]